MNELTDSKQQLQKYLWRITEIYINAKENFNYSYYLHNPNTSEELAYLNKEENLKFIRHSLWRLTVIELAKLFSSRPNDKFNLIALISKLRPGGHFGELHVDQNKVNQWEQIIQSRSVLIDHIITLRDKIYAHTDPDKDDYRNVDIYFTEVLELFEFVEQILKQINSETFSVHLDLRTPVFDRRDFKLIKILAEYRRRGN